MNLRDFGSGSSKRHRVDAQQLLHPGQRRIVERQVPIEAGGDEPAPFRPSSDVKRLFRQIAQKIHPDRAMDEVDRAWRTRLMSEANRAYRAGDEVGLHEVAMLWQEGQDGRRDLPAENLAVSPAPTLLRQVERMRARLGQE